MTTTTEKFFEFHQNNSGGHFWVTEEIGHRTFIQAKSPAEANEKALQIGIYFDGVSSGADCECCGNRFSEIWENDTGCLESEIKFSTYASTGDTMVIHYANGESKRIAKA